MAQELPFSIYVIAYAVAILVTAKAVRAIKRALEKVNPTGVAACGVVCTSTHLRTYGYFTFI